MNDLFFHRGRRLRTSSALREMVRESFVRPSDLVMPYFVVEGEEKLCAPIKSMPGQNQLGLASLYAKVEKAMANGLRSVLLFGLPAKKDERGSGAYDDEGIVQQAVRGLKERFPELYVITDVCLCEYTSHGHCGMLNSRGEVLNDPTLDLLSDTALSHVRAGADMVAPSDMMDGRIAAIRKVLDDNRFEMTPIMSYAVKYASAYYGPFRDAAESAPQFGDRKAYQMDPANWREALREAAADVSEGADIIMVKPGQPYLDILKLLRDNFETPLAVYQVSGEYAMLKAAALNGWIDEERCVMESLLGFKRAGASLILTYFSEDALEYLKRT